MRKKNTISRFTSREFVNIILYSAGTLVSIFGSSIYTFAMGLYVLELTGSGLSFSTTLILGILPVIFINPFAGVLADKFNKKKLIVGMDVLSGLFLIALYLVTLRYGLTLNMIYLSTFMISIFSTIFGISVEAGKLNIVQKQNLVQVNAISHIIISAAAILGPLIGGFVYAFIDINVFIIVNGISFFMSGISEMFISFHFNLASESIDASKEVFSFKDEIIGGYQYIKARPELVHLIKIFIALNFAFSFSMVVPIPFIINNVLKLGSVNYGIIQGSMAVGMIFGALLVSSIISKMPYQRLLFMLSYALVFVSGIFVMPLMIDSGSVPQYAIVGFYCLLMGFVGLMIALIDIPVMSILQLEPDEAYRGRVMSLSISTIKIITPISYLISGFLLNQIPAHYIPLIGGFTLLVTTFLLSFNTTYRGYKFNLNIN